MNHISIELVPRGESSLHKDLQTVVGAFQKITAVNIPDIVRFDLRSWEAAAIAKQYFNHCIPHIRAYDFGTDEKLSTLLQFLDAHKLTSILVISGDANETKRSSHSAIDLIGALKQKAHGLTVYAGVDPYRSSLKQENEYIAKKRAVGADGFFTQPFFDLRLLEIYHELLQDRTVFWGVSPVAASSSARYWEKRNNVVFPKDFEPTLEWNRAFAERAVEYVNKNGGNLYFMPIKVDIVQYLKGIL